jgi:hypothetical protein
MRIVALGDQHGFLPDVPPCDLLIVAGDVCPDRFGPFMAVHDPHQQRAWFDRKIRPWLASAPATHKVLTWGNHDWCGQMCSFRSDTPAHARSTDLQILVDEGTSVPSAGDAGREMSVWATPWSNKFMRWAFMKQPSDLERVYAARLRAFVYSERQHELAGREGMSEFTRVFERDSRIVVVPYRQALPENIGPERRTRSGLRRFTARRIADV